MNIAIYGKGNVGTHLFKALKSSRDDQVELLSSRDPESMSKTPDLIILTVTDDAIEKVASEIKSKMPDFKGLVVHTSGSTGIEVLKPYFKNFGVLYPLQTFSKDKYLDYSLIPVFIEGSNDSSSKILKKTALKFTSRVYEADSATRCRLHIASVFACNFTNAMYHIADGLLKESGFTLDILYPLIGETASKILDISPALAQTGPAKRRDKTVISKHLAQLSQKPGIAEIYDIITDYIFKFSDNN